jgi:glycosyltransferase involved in cell wall biosynthesis
LSTLGLVLQEHLGRSSLSLSNMSAKSTPIAFVLKGYPRYTETFVAQEILALEKRGLNIRIYSQRSTGLGRHPVHDEIKAPITYLPEYMYQAPARVWRAWRRIRRKPGYKSARRALFKDFLKDPTPGRLRKFGHALVLANELPNEVKHLHAHFLHAPATIVRYTAFMLDLPWSCSAHAIDIWTSPEWDKRNKLADMEWLVTCTRTNAEHLSDIAPNADRIELLYHGLDFVRFPKVPSAPEAKANNEPIQLFSVGRAVEKKGYDYLIQALALIPKDLKWKLTHIGTGPLLDRLKHQAKSAGIGDKITWLGEQPQTTVLDYYRSCDIFVLACRVASNGDRDGLPNVLMEAQSQALPCLTTTASDAPELIIDGQTGLLVPPEDAPKFAEKLELLLRDPKLRSRLGQAGMKRVRSEFSLNAGIDKLFVKFGGPS